MCKVWPTHKKNPWVSIENMEEIFFEYQVAVTISIFYVAIYYDIISEYLRHFWQFSEHLNGNQNRRKMETFNGDVTAQQRAIHFCVDLGMTPPQIFK